MKKIDNLWKERLQLYTIEMRKYLKYIFNDHLLFVAIFALSGGAYYYSRWVKTLDHHFPIGWVMGLILGLVITISPIYTLLKNADKVFLLPLETKLQSYFRKAIKLSFVIQSYILLMVLAVLMPMYVHSTGGSFRSFFFYLIIMWILKYWNLFMHWDVLKFRDPQVEIFDWIIRFALNTIFVFLLVEKAPFWYVGVLIVLYIGVYQYFHRLAKEKTIKWDLLIEKEEKRLTGFYRFANLFTDVPKLKGQVKRRKWLDPILNRVKYGQQNTYRYLFARTFVRTSEYFGLFVRLTIIGGLILLFSDQRYLMIGVALVFLYLTGFQLIPMVRYHELKIWLHLYPVSMELKKSSFLKVITTVLMLQALIFGILALISSSWVNGVLVLLIGIVFVLLLVKIYIPSRLKKIDTNF
ncbi:ABC transporter [Heyndrickxia shackletonii]|uniref:ABC transporter n=1 Tax=Heyndrickxia shackletonii TaxID=157838 RepID=A0A0Q3TM81_9BACI|nr:ABC transporter permease [Heyndrickxia shackletonii]KQL55080.1 ABC transporter [Heyndrickxia shackletonii]NEZ01370.1 ABC transporter permease [Heyndrickxia shackletonii]